MNLDKSQDRAQSVTTPKQAATLYNSIEYELAMGDPDPAQEQNGERALSVLEERFPDVKAQARDIDQPPALSRTGKQALDATGGAGSGTPSPGPRRGGAHPGGGSRGGGSRRQPHPRTRSSSSAGGRRSAPPRRSPAGSSAPRSSGGGGGGGSRSRSSSSLPGLGDLAPSGFDATDSALFVLRAILVLGLGYFLLSKRGSSALSTVLGGVTTAVGLIVSPVDPLGSSASVAKGSKVPTINVPGTSSAPPASLTGGNNPRGTTILGGGSTSTPGATARQMANRLIPLGGNYPTGRATGAMGSQVRQSTGPYGGGSTQ